MPIRHGIFQWIAVRFLMRLYPLVGKRYVPQAKVTYLYQFR